MILDAFSVELDKLIMDNRKPNTNLGELKSRLGKVKVIVED
jgi:hypothetical protein